MPKITISVPDEVCEVCTLPAGTFAVITDASAQHRQGDLIYAAGEDVVVDLTARLVWLPCNEDRALDSWEVSPLRQGTKIRIEITGDPQVPR